MPLNKKTIRDINLSGKRALVRCDFNVPQDEEGRITDDRRISEALPTIRELLAQGAAVVLASHLGRPKGRDEKYTLRPVAERLSGMLGFEVPLAPDCVGEDVATMASELEHGRALLLENVRFHAEEEANDPEFAKQLASLADVYVNDAFGTAHRAHASTEGVARLLPAVAGFLMEKEIKFLGDALENPRRPYVAVMGGAKVKDKIGVIENLLPKIDSLLIGGGMAFTFYKAKGYEIGKSILDEENVEFARKILSSEKVKVAEDVVAASELKDDAETRVVLASELPSDMLGADIGPAARSVFSRDIESAGAVVWNGPMGVFELKPFSEGTKAVAEAMSRSEGVTVVCGGESAAAVQKFGYADKITHVSTGGGASLEFIEGKKLPGVEALEDVR